MGQWLIDGELYTNSDGNLVTIQYDWDCESPRRSYDNLGHFLTWMSRYNSPDENCYDYPDELAGDLGIYDEDGNNGDLLDLIRGMNGMGWVAMPVSKMEHSDVVYRTGDPRQFVGAYPWDAGYVGLIYASANEICEHFMVDEVTEDIRKRAEEVLTGEVELYSDWADGACYEYVMYDIDGNEVDACSGFIGYDSEENNMEEHTGTLHECDFDNLEEYVEAHAYDVTIKRAAQFAQAA